MWWIQNHWLGGGIRHADLFLPFLRLESGAISCLFVLSILGSLVYQLSARHVNQVVWFQVSCPPLGSDVKEELSFNIQEVYLLGLVDV